MPLDKRGNHEVLGSAKRNRHTVDFSLLPSSERATSSEMHVFGVTDLRFSSRLVFIHLFFFLQPGRLPPEFRFATDADRGFLALLKAYSVHLSLQVNNYVVAEMKACYFNPSFFFFLFFNRVSIISVLFKFVVAAVVHSVFAAMSVLIPPSPPGQHGCICFIVFFLYLCVF